MPRVQRILRLALLLVVLVAALLSAPAPAEAQGYRVIVHPDNPVDSMTESTVSRFFLRRVTSWDHGPKVEPVDQPEGSSVREAFSEGVHGRGVSEIKAFWNRNIFSGRALPPPVLEGDRAVVEYVREHPGAIGYVSPGAGTSGVKVVRVTD